MEIVIGRTDADRDLRYCLETGVFALQPANDNTWVEGQALGLVLAKAGFRVDVNAHEALIPNEATHLRLRPAPGVGDAEPRDAAEDEPCEMPDARTIWAAARTWLERNADEEKRMAERGDVFRLAGLHVCVYPKGQTGCYLISRGRLYWDDDPKDGHYSNTDDDLPQADGISHVVLWAPYLRAVGERYWPSWAEFAKEMRLPC